MGDSNPSAPEVPYQSWPLRRPRSLHPGFSPEGGGLLAVIERLATNPQSQHRSVRPAPGRAPPGGGPRRRARLQRRDERSQGRDPAGPQDARCRLPVEVQAAARAPNTGTRASPMSRASSTRCSPGTALSYRFRISQKADQVTVTCIVSHADGYSEETSPLESKVDPGSTGMSMVQALGSALTYLQSYSLRAADRPRGWRRRRRERRKRNVAQDQRRAGRRSCSSSSMKRAAAPRRCSLCIGVDDKPDAMTVDQWMRVKAALDLAKADQRRSKNAPGNDNAPRN